VVVERGNGRVRVLVVGADPSGRGFGARAHIPAVNALLDAELTAVCTEHEATAKAAAARWQVDRFYHDYEAAVADEQIDLVTIAVRVRLHLPIAQAAIEAGKMVYCEWPLCLDSAQATRLAALPGLSRTTVGVGLQGRFSPAVRQARELLAEGAIGRPVSFVATHVMSRFDVRSDRWWLAQEDEGSGALHVATAHVTDTVQYLLGPIESLSGMRDTLEPDGVFSDTGVPFRWTASDTVAYSAHLAGGCLGVVFATNIAGAPRGFALRIVGDEAEMLLEAPGYVSYSPCRLSVGRRGDAEMSSVPVATRPDRHEPLSGEHPGANVALALEDLITADRAGRRFVPGVDEAIELHRLVERIGQSRFDTP